MWQTKIIHGILFSWARGVYQTTSAITWWCKIHQGLPHVPLKHHKQQLDYHHFKPPKVMFPPRKGHKANPWEYPLVRKIRWLAIHVVQQKHMLVSMGFIFLKHQWIWNRVKLFKKTYLLAAGFPLQLLPNRGLSLKSIICNLSFMSGVLVLHTRSPPTKPCVCMYRNIDTVPADQHPPLSILTAYPCRSYCTEQALIVNCWCLKPYTTWDG